MDSKKYEEIILCGLDQCGCVYHTAMGALKETKNVYIVSNSTGCRFKEKKKNRIKNKLVSLGVKYI